MGSAVERTNGSGGFAPKMTKKERDERILALALDGQATTPTTMANARQKLNQPLPPEIKEHAHKMKQTLKGFRRIFQPLQSRIYMNRAKQAPDSEMEAELFDPMVQQLMGVDGLPAGTEILNRSSLLRGGNPSIQRHFHNLKEVALADRGACIRQAPSPLGLTGMSDMLERKFGASIRMIQSTQKIRAEKMRKYLAKRAHFAVMIH